MRQRSWIGVGLAIWAILYVASFVAAGNTTPTGDSFLRGINRLTVFFQIQIASGLVAVLIWFFGMRFERGTWQRWVSRAPALLAIGLVALIVAIILMANFRKPSPDAPAPVGPMTMPLDQPVKSGSGD